MITGKDTEIREELLYPQFLEGINPRTIFLDPAYSLEKESYGVPFIGNFLVTYNYSYRLKEWYKGKEQQAWIEAILNKEPLTIAFYECYLQNLLLDSKLTLVHMLAGVNMTTKSPYWIFGYIRGS